MTRLVLGPFNRVEGDLEVTLDIGAGYVRSAEVSSPLFRGFEQLLVGRPAEDALVIVPRICGICSIAQSAAAAVALADLAGCEIAPNGQLANRLLQATENLADHLSHFYLFFMPDFARSDYASRPWHPGIEARFAALTGSANPAALTARASLLRLIGFMAGKWPHTLAIQPGGNTKAMTAGERIRILALLRDFRQFLEGVLIGDHLESFSAINNVSDLRAWAQGREGDFPAFLGAAFDLSLEQLGGASDNFVSYGAYELFPAGVRMAGGAPERLEAAKITEDSRFAWLDESSPLPPARGETRVLADKADAYTWCKAPRYDCRVMETGALARQVVAGQALLCDFIARHGASVVARVVARMLELAVVMPAMERWVGELKAGEAFCLPATMPESGEGSGLVEAARGALGHWISVRRGRIERYQIVAPTTWNFSPRDREGCPGPLEQALVGLPAGNGALPLVQHVVRSFDPCMVCTVH